MHKDSFRLQTMTAFNKKFLRMFHGGSFFKKHPVKHLAARGQKYLLFDVDLGSKFLFASSLGESHGNGMSCAFSRVDQ